MRIPPTGRRVASSRRVALMALCALAPFLRTPGAPADEGGRGGKGPRSAGGAGGGPGGPPWVFRTEVPAHDVDVVLGRPTRDSVTVSVRTTIDAEGRIEWRPAGAKEARRTPVRAYVRDSPASEILEGLTPDTAYVARFLMRRPPAADPTAGEELAFHTQRAPGQAFEFTVQADSHLDAGTDPALYERTVRNVADERPDFHVDLGDTFMTDKYRDDFHAALPQYVAQRWYLGLVRVPTYLVLGNHDGETGWRDRGIADDMPHWSNTQRKRLFPNPSPDGFYTGNEARDALNGLLENWYAFEWGDALFLALDPFWSTTNRKGRDADPWSWTLGDAQYHWLEKMLSTRRAKLRFVFIHHLVGGSGPEARGGAEVARSFEWGGRSADGKDAFGTRRPGFSAPIHDLLRKAGPTVVFHGHDHFFAHQELEGVVYQVVPQPGHAPGDAAKMAAEYGYLTGDFLSSPGHVRVRVAPDAATVELVRSSRSSPSENGKVSFSYRVPTATR